MSTDYHIEKPRLVCPGCAVRKLWLAEDDEAYLDGQKLIVRRCLNCAWRGTIDFESSQTSIGTIHIRRAESADCCDDCRTALEERTVLEKMNQAVWQKAGRTSPFCLTFKCDGEAGDVVVLTKKSPYLFRGQKFNAEDDGAGTSILIAVGKYLAVPRPYKTALHRRPDLGSGTRFPDAQINDDITLFVFFPKKGSWSGTYCGMAAVTDHPHEAP